MPKLCFRPLDPTNRPWDSPRSIELENWYQLDRTRASQRLQNAHSCQNFVFGYKTLQIGPGTPLNRQSSEVGSIGTQRELYSGCRMFIRARRKFRCLPCVSSMHIIHGFIHGYNLQIISMDIIQGYHPIIISMHLIHRYHPLILSFGRPVPPK